MKLNNNTLYHVYNQGNNRQNIFFSDENYKYFLWKMRSYLLPFGDMVAYCLMANHYHWLLYIKKKNISKQEFRKYIDKIENLRRQHKYGSNAILINTSIKEYKTQINDTITINESIGILQKSYTEAINQEQSRSGSLFRQQFKAKKGWIDEFAIDKNNKKSNFSFNSNNNYAFECLNYIHENPVKSGLVTNRYNWDYSSARNYNKLRNGNLCNLDIGNNLIDFV